MGKTSSPSYSNGYVNVNGSNVASNYRSGNNIYSSYNMSDAEKQIYDYAQNSFLSNLPNVNVFSEDTINQLQNQLGAYTNQGLKLINNTYTPMLNNMKTDIASRFGNFDNSVFMDNLNKIESNRSDSMSAFAQDIMAKQNELYNDELSRRYDYMNFLLGTQNNIDSNILNYLGLASQNSNMGNTYNTTSSKYNSGGFSSNNLFSNLSQSLLSNGNASSLMNILSLL